MRITLRAAAAILAASVMGLAANAMAQGAYPNKPVKLIVTFPPAGITDTLARIIAQKLQEETGQPFIVDNRPGAGGNIGMEAIARAPADGYTFGMVITSHAINMSMGQPLNYDVTKDVAPVRLLVMSANVLSVHPSVPANSVKELIALAKAKKMPLNFASAGNGTTPHLSGELFKQMAKVDMQHVPYKGAGPAMADLLGGQVQMMFDAVSTAAPYIKSGKIRPLGVTSAKRSPILPDVPTISEAGLPGYVIDGWIGVVAPAATPPEIIEWLSSHISKIYQSEEVKAEVKKNSLELVDLPPEKFKPFIAAEVVKWKKIIDASGARLD
jgi:tripartite-type tricarboxylate transporter receptor subunit TctC